MLDLYQMNLIEGTKWNRELPDEFTAALYNH